MSKARKVEKQASTVAVGYVRVSTDQQADSGVSLEAQAEKIGAMATVHGVELLEIITDAGASAKTIDRPGLNKLLKLVESGNVSTVIIAKLDRLTRSVKDLAELLERFEKCGVSLVSVAESLDTASAAGRLVLNIMVSVSQWEREAIGERTTAALQHKRAHSRVYNHTPYGYERDGDRLVCLPKERAVIERIHTLRADGHTLNAIAELLNVEGIPTKKGSRWFAQTVKDVLTNNVKAECAA